MPYLLQYITNKKMCLRKCRYSQCVLFVNARKLSVRYLFGTQKYCASPIDVLRIIRRNLCLICCKHVNSKPTKVKIPKSS